MSRSGGDPVLSTEEKEKAASTSSHRSTDEGSVTLSRKSQLSPYFTIAAAAFGLISDGCEIYTFVSFVCKCTHFSSIFQDQNNLMTMANVGTATYVEGCAQIAHGIIIGCFQEALP